MAESIFPYELCTWAPGDKSSGERWLNVLERTGPENVRTRLAQTDAGSGGAISIGSEHSITIGFAQEWLAWHDRQKAIRENEFRGAQVFATRWAAGAATVAALAAAVGWAWTILHK